MKIKKLEIENDDFKLYLDNLNSLLTEYNNKGKKRLQNKPEPKWRNISFYKSLDELNKFGVTCSFYISVGWKDI